MCGIAGVLAFEPKNGFVPIEKFLEKLTQRGRDSIGFSVVGFDGGELSLSKELNQSSIFDGSLYPLSLSTTQLAMFNVRAIPTSISEGGAEMSVDYLQPYVTKTDSGFHKMVIHNGTIANDDKLNKEFNYFHMDSSTRLTNIPIDSTVFLNEDTYSINRALQEEKIIGSYSGALWDEHDQQVVLFKNYLPLHVMVDFENKLIWWANVKDALLEVSSKEVAFYDVPAYTSITLSYDKTFEEMVYSLTNQIKHPGNLYKKQGKEKALIVCSSGLDSTTVATLACRKYGADNTVLLHYHYGCKAEDREKERIVQIAEHLKCQYKFVDISPVFAGMKSPILGHTGDISTGDKGIEYAHEYVNARNLIMMSIAIGIAEDLGCTTVQLGANLTEQAAYPDNSLDFIEKLNALVPYSVQNNTKIRVEAPLVNMMKQEIVKLGLEIGVPYDKTWSCYHDYANPCGECGPCVMRQIAFSMNNAVDPLVYDKPQVA